MKTAIVTDSTAYLTAEIREKYDIHMIPLSVVIDGNTYEEEVNITASAYYEVLKEKKDLPTTSQPPIGKFVELFEKLAKDYDNIISIHLSSGISGTYQGAITAASMVEGVKVYPFDSGLSCMAQGFYAIDASKLAQEGKDPETIIKVLENQREYSKAYFIVDDLSNLQKGGRLTNAQAILGSMLRIKPILHFEDKKIVPLEKIRTKKKAMARIIELLQPDAITGQPLKASVIHANREGDAIEWKQQIEYMFPNVEVTISYFGPVISTHLGEGAIGLVWMPQ